MSLFDELVDQALQNKPELSPLRVVIEKELLHHDIMRVLASAGLLSGLTFMGGTCLRACYGSSRLSEDLDFTGGAGFTHGTLARMADVLVQSLKTKYGLDVAVAEPMRDIGNVDTWKLKVQTRPGRKDLPAQRINIDVCAISSYQPRPMMLLNPYGVEMGTSGLVLQAQSREEIFVDKLVAFALRPNRIKNRDLWDIAWLHQQQISPALDLLSDKLSDHQAPTNEYLQAFSKRVALMQSQPTIAKDFRFEMRRFLPNPLVKDTVESDDFWAYVFGLMQTYAGHVKQTLTRQPPARVFKM
jgi:predicted nucleotidyltransferase component of viral defense system